MRKKQYLKRLKGMLEYNSTPCCCCPTGKYYRWSAESFFAGATPEGCEWCKKLLTKKRKASPVLTFLYNFARNCPCVVLGNEKAVEKAWKVLAKEGMA